ncbi:MAG: hypothetical protein ABR921_13310 [Candidatus Sulfotelmatobacter sp.]
MLPSTFMSAAPQFAPAACSLAAVFIWGTSDFTGGYASRRANAFVFTAAAHACHASFPSRAGILWALLAGGIGGFSLAVFYRALAEGKMGLTAPIAALLGAAIPTLADIAIEGAPHAWTFAGFALAIVAIWLITRAEPVRSPTQDSARQFAKENNDQIDDEEKPGAVPKGVAVAALSGVDRRHIAGRLVHRHRRRRDRH